MTPVLVGRRAERDVLLDAVSRAAAGDSQVVWLGGPAGSGKTALVDAVVESLPPETVLRRAWADPLAQEQPFEVLAQLGPVTSSTPFAAGLELLDHLASLQDDGPVVVVVEDLHWADELSLQALLTVARRLERDHVLLIVTSRDVTDPDTRELSTAGPGIAAWERLRLDDRACRQVRAAPLDVDAVSAWCAALGLALRPESVERLVAHTRGHPLYLRTLLEELTPEQLDRSGGGLPAPRTLAMTTVGRLAERSTAARSLCSALAVLDGRRALADVAACVDVDDPDAALEDLLHTGFVTWWPSEPGTPVAFTHPLHRRAVYDDLAPTTRRRLHHAAVDVVAPSEQLAHRLAASLGPDEALTRDLLDAAATAVAAGETAAGAHRMLEALLVADAATDADRVLLAAATLLLDDDRTRAVDELRPRLEGVAHGPGRDLVLGRHDYLRGDSTAARTSLRRSLDAAVAADDAVLVSLAGMHLAVLEAQAGDGEATATAARTAIDAAGDAGVDGITAAQRAWTALAVGVAVQRGGSAGLSVLRDEMPEVLVASADADLVAVRGMLSYYAGRTTAAIADLRRVVGAARDGAGPQQLARAHVHLAQSLVLAGAPAEALVSARQGLSISIDGSSSWVEAQAHAALVTAAAATGELETARGHLHRAQAAADRLGTAEARYAVALAATALHRAADEPGPVVRIWAERAAERGDAPPPSMTALEFVPALIDALVDVGLHDVAAERLDQFATGAAALDLPFASRHLRLLGRLALAAGDPDGATQRYDEALGAVVEDDPVLDRLLLHRAAGALHLRRGRRRDGVDQLRAALALAEGMGARHLRERIEDELRTAGIATARSDERSPIELTDREHDVAVLVQRGLTNKEAAAELYVSPKAVEFHLRNIYAKLGVRSRQELRRRGIDTPTA